MRTEVETSQIDRRYESYRMRSEGREKQLLSSILAKGIEEPLCGVQTSPAVSSVLLLDGFKRLRCAQKLKINHLPFISLGEDEATAILSFLRNCNSKSLTMLEQAKLVDELKRVHGLSVTQIAKRLERSQAWVCTRISVLSEMSDKVMREIFSGRFPAYSFFYTLRQFRRLNGVPKKELDDFVGAVSGHGCSTRDIESLAKGYFCGGEGLKEQIRQGDLAWCLGQLKSQVNLEGQAKLSDLESRVLRDLELLQGSMGRLTLKLGNPELKGPDFFAQAELLTDGISNRVSKFLEILGGFGDRLRQEQGRLPTP
jgi:ParB/RepB/Spo0J family partition protein